MSRFDATDSGFDGNGSKSRGDAKAPHVSSRRLREAFSRHLAAHGRYDSASIGYDSWNCTDNPRMPADPAERARLNAEWQEKVGRAGDERCATRRELFELILDANGYRDGDSFPPVSLPLGSRRLWLLPPEDEGDNLLNATLLVKLA